MGGKIDAVINEISSDEEDTRKRKKTGSLTYKHKGGVVELHVDNLKCLEQGQCLRDNIIQFYGAYLVNEICSTKNADRVYIFDTIFHRQLDKLFGNKESPVDAVQLRKLPKWYNGIDIFKKDFLIFPVCMNNHWFVIVVCYARAVRSFAEFVEDPLSYSEKTITVGDNDFDQENPHPGIMIMDSMGPKNSGTITLNVREFIDNEWRSRPGEPIKRFSHNDLPDYIVQLPKQTNTFDCGVYMLMYMRCFLETPDAFYESVVKTKKPRADMLTRLEDELLSDDTRVKMSTLITNLCDKT